MAASESNLEGPLSGGESREGRKHRFLPIIRSDNGVFFGFGEPEVPGVDEMKGRFAQILPPKVPNDDMQEVAKAMAVREATRPANSNAIGSGFTPRPIRCKRSGRRTADYWLRPVISESWNTADSRQRVRHVQALTLYG